MYHFYLQTLNYHFQYRLIKFTIFCVSIVYTTVTEFCVKLKVVRSDFSIIKSIVAPVFLKSLPIKLIFCGSFSLVCLLRSIAINL